MSVAPRIRVKVTTSFPKWDIVRQTVGRRAEWGDCSFFVNEDVDECDYWIVLEGLTRAESTVCPRNNRALITMEPPSIKRYRPSFLRQFREVVTCHQGLSHPRVTIGQQSLPWLVGGKRTTSSSPIRFEFGYDRLKETSVAERKKRSLSVIVSNKTKTRDQKARLTFVEFLQDQLGDELDWFGRGFRWAEDKWDGLEQYRYTLALENCYIDDYWTEKIGDAFLAECHPFYYGCPNLDRYFQPASFTRIDVHRKHESLAIIRKTLDSDVYAKSVSAVGESKRRVLDEYNVFRLMHGLASGCTRADYRRTDLVPESDCAAGDGFLSKIGRRLGF